WWRLIKLGARLADSDDAELVEAVLPTIDAVCNGAFAQRRASSPLHTVSVSTAEQLSASADEAKLHAAA
ncbi:MAG TPA: hypothetical protein VGF99_09975, partial [Myxococcota bacterium]